NLAAGAVAPLEHEHALAGLRQVVRRHQAVEAGADDEGVVARAHFPPPSSRRKPGPMLPLLCMRIAREKSKWVPAFAGMTMEGGHALIASPSTLPAPPSCPPRPSRHRRDARRTRRSSSRAAACGSRPTAAPGAGRTAG